MFLIDRLSYKNIEIISKSLKGKRLQKFLESISIINESLQQQGWIKRGSVKSKSGFSQGILSHLKSNEVFDNFDKSDESHKIYMCFKYGFPGASINSLKSLNKDLFLKYPLDFYKAWIELCNEREEAVDLLNSFRPIPEISHIGLSPKVTATLVEMNLDLDIQSIKMPKIVPEIIPVTDSQGLHLKNPKTGKPLFKTIYKIEWSKNIQHNKSRFSEDIRCCQACGKNIPSQRFVPVEAFDKKSSQLISMWLGQDCAKNIFGIKDAGVQKE